MQGTSSMALAISCFRRAAELGDPVSSFNLGYSLLQGKGIQNDIDGERSNSEVAHWLQRAATTDYPYAAALLTSSNLGQPVAPPPSLTKNIQFDTEFALYPKSSDVDREVLSADPSIAIMADVLDIIDRAYLIFISRPSMKPSSVINPRGDHTGMVSKIRTSMSTYISFEMVDVISRYIELKIIIASGEELTHSEPMSILRYAQGEYYRPHFDFFNPTLDVSKQLMENGGQRTASAITYLSVPTSGGGTSFPNLNLTVPAVGGSTLWFRNCSPDGQVDKRSLHAGDTVLVGEKWVVTKWFRENPTSYLKL
jgi:prolyl 4-hydroxylase